MDHSTCLAEPRRAAQRALLGVGIGFIVSQLAACGGGGDDPPAAPVASYFAIEGTQAAGGAPLTVCIDGIGFIDPNTDAGRGTADALVRYFGISGNYRSYSGDGRGCMERFPGAAVVISVDDFLHVVLPAVKVGPAPAPAPAPAPQPTPAPGPSPTPSPLPGPIACAETAGNGVGGLQLYGNTRLGPLGTTAGLSAQVSLDPGEIAYADPNFTSAATTGTLRSRLWAVGSSYGGGSISGYVVSEYRIRFSDGSTQLRNGQSANLVEQTLAALTPPVGAYCMVVTLEEYDSVNCSSADNFCIADWAQFPTSLSFR